MCVCVCARARARAAAHAVSRVLAEVDTCIYMLAEVAEEGGEPAGLAVCTEDLKAARDGFVAAALRGVQSKEEVLWESVAGKRYI